MNYIWLIELYIVWRCVLIWHCLWFRTNSNYSKYRIYTFTIKTVVLILINDYWIRKQINFLNRYVLCNTTYGICYINNWKHYTIDWCKYMIWIWYFIDILHNDFVSIRKWYTTLYCFYIFVMSYIRSIR